MSAEERIDRALGSAARARALDDPESDAYLALLGQLDERFRGQVDRGVRSLLERLVRGAWTGGWQPNDLTEHARRRLDGIAEPLLVEAIASEHRAYTDSTLDPRWLEQLADLGLRDRPSAGLDLTTWAAQHRMGRYLGLETAVAVAAFLLTLPVLPRLLPIPGAPGAGRPTAVRRTGENEKVLGRIRALLAKAEATEFPDEAEALSAKAQELMAKFSLDRALVDAAPDAELADGSAARRIWVETPYVTAKTQLVDAVASANRCRTVMTEQLAFITVVGNELDLQLTELLSTSLLVQANRAMLAAGKHTGQYGESRTRSFRQSFLVAYAHRIGERLRTTAEATQAAVPEVDADRLLPVLSRREEKTEALFTKLFPNTVERRTRVSNGAGWQAGRTAADLATLNAHQAVRR